MTVEQALKVVEDVFANVQANKLTHRELEKVLQFLKEKLIQNGGKDGEVKGS